MRVIDVGHERYKCEPLVRTDAPRSQERRFCKLPRLHFIQRERDALGLFRPDGNWQCQSQQQAMSETWMGFSARQLQYAGCPAERKLCRQTIVTSRCR